MRKSMLPLIAIFLMVPLYFYGCGTGDTGPAGVAGASGTNGTSAPTTGTVSGTVTDATKGDALVSVTVTATDRATGGAVLATTTTDAAGGYSLTVPIGGCYVNFAKTYYTQPGGMFVGIGGGITTTLNATMAEAASGAPSVSFAAEAGDDYGYGNTIAVAASANLSVSDPNDTTLTYAWTNTTSPRQADYTYLGTVTGTGAAGSITFPTMAQAFATRLARNAAGAAGVTGGSDVSGYVIPDRFGILPIYPDTRGAIGARVTVSDGRGKSTAASITLNAASILPGVRDVPLNTRVYLNRGNDNASQTWTLTKPSGSTAALDNATVRTPSFKPDVAGTYTVAAGGNTWTIYAGSYAGVITGGAGNAFTVDSGCTVCHQGAAAVDAFTPWQLTNHATLFTRNINITVALGGDPEGRSCMACHVVGYDPGAANGGFDDKMYAFDNNWLAWGGYITPDANNWANLFSAPASAAMAKLANIQCENCHGPNNSLGHMTTGPLGDIASNNPFASARISYSAEVCAQCHGRTSHNFYSQWATPNASGGGHSNRALAIEEGTGNRNNCAKCHSAQGFMLFLDQLAAGKPGYLDNGTTLSLARLGAVTATTVEPITCTACHDPHQVTVLDGFKTRPSDGAYIYKQLTNNQLRVFRDTAVLPSGFRVTGFGKGALCVTCHNSRNAVLADNTTYLHEDDVTNTPTTFTGGASNYSTAPHAACQGDVVAGRNAYFLSGQLPMVSRHAAVEDSCVGCHMVLNPVKKGARDASTGLLTGVSKSHLFRLVFDEDLTKPETQVRNFCANCHGAGTVDGESVKAATEAGLAVLKPKIEAALLLALNGYGETLINVSGTGFNDNVWSGDFSAVVLGTRSNSLSYTTSLGVVKTGKSVSFANTKFAVAGTPVFATGDAPIKAVWNYYLIEEDQSLGLHNPTFTQAVLNATTRAVDAWVAAW